MRIYSQTLKNTAGCLLALATLMAASRLGAADTEEQTQHSSSATVTVTAGGGGAGGAGGGAVSEPGEIIINRIESIAEDDPPARKDRPWLGVSIEESSEALASQLDLAPGSGLVVTYVAPDSPAAKARLQKNDVLVNLESQLLVHPAQLRKLLQGRKEGDAIELSFYRAGKKQTASATLGRPPSGFGWFDEGRPWRGELRQLRELLPPDAIRDQMQALRDSLGHLKNDQSKAAEEVRRGVEQAKKAWKDAFRYSSNSAWAPAAKALRDLQQSGVAVDNNASVTVRSTGQSVKSIVKADESGTFVLVSNPKPHLTAHDKDGKLLFDGEIDTPEQRAKVPPELWEKVEPLLEKVAPNAEDEPEAKPAPPKGPSPRDNRPPAPMPLGRVPTL